MRSNVRMRKMIGWLLLLLGSVVLTIRCNTEYPTPTAIPIPETEVRGEVRFDNPDQPAALASVSIVRGTTRYFASARTTSAGMYWIVVPAGEATIEEEAAFCYPYSAPINVQPGPNTFNIRLQVMPRPSDSTAGAKR